MPVLLMKVQVVEEMRRTVYTFACASACPKRCSCPPTSRTARSEFSNTHADYDRPSEELILMHVQDVRKLRPHLAARMDEFNRVDTERLTAPRRGFEPDGFSVKVRLSKGVPFQEIMRVADEEDVGMITIGTHGRSALGEVLLGSVSQEVIRSARQPILVVLCAKLCSTSERPEQGARPASQSGPRKVVLSVCASRNRACGAFASIPA